MSRDEWRGYATRATLVSAWGVVDATVRDYAAEASRRFRLEPGELDAARARASRKLEAVARHASSMVNLQTGLPDFRAVIDAIEKAAMFNGSHPDVEKAADVDAPKSAARVEIVFTDKDDAVDHAASESPEGQ